MTPADGGAGVVVGILVNHCFLLFKGFSRVGRRASRQISRSRRPGDHIHSTMPENRGYQATVGDAASPQNEADQERHHDSTASLVTMREPEENGRKQHHRPSL